MAIPLGSLSADIGASVGQGLGSGLQALAEYKLNQMRSAQQRQNLQMLLPNASPAEIDAIIRSPQQFQGPLLKNALQRRSNIEFGKEFERARGEGNIPAGQETLPSNLDLLSQTPEYQAASGMDLLKQRQAPAILQHQIRPEQQIAAPTPGKPSTEFLTPQQQVEIAKFRQGEQKREAGQQQFILQNYIQPLSKKAETARQTETAWKELIPLIESGKVHTGRGRALAEDVGIKDYLTNPETALAEGLLTSMATGAGAAFNTARLTNLEVGTYKDSLARLRNPQDMILLRAKNEILKQKAVKLRDKEAKNLLREKRNISPVDFELELDNRIQPKLKQLADKSVQNVQDMLKKEGISPEAKRTFATAGNIPEGAKVKNRVTGKLEQKINGQMVPIEG